MSKKKSKYKPKGVRVDAVNWVLAGLKRIPEVAGAGTKLMIRNHASFDEIREGRGDKDHVDTLIHMVNMTEALAKRQLGRDWLDEIGQAQDAIYNMAMRGVNGKPFLFTGEEIGIVMQIIELHDEQLKNCTVKLLETAIDDVAECYKKKQMRVIAPQAVAA